MLNKLLFFTCDYCGLLLPLQGLNYQTVINPLNIPTQ